MAVTARRSFLGAVLTLAALSPALAGQGGRSEITGTVVDQAKAVLPGVTITVVNEATGLERTATTSGDGRFVIPTLVPGTYTVKAELQGFQTVDPDRRRPQRRPGNGRQPDARRGRSRRDGHRHRRIPARRNDVEQNRLEHHECRDRQPAESGAQPVGPHAARAGTHPEPQSRIIRRRSVQRQRPGDDLQPVPRRRRIRQRRSARRLAGHAGAGHARHDG